MPDALHLAYEVLIWLAAVPATVSVIVHAFTPWRETRVGRHLFWYMLVIAVVLDVQAARLLGHDTWWSSALQLGVFVGAPIVIWWRLVLQLDLFKDHGPPEQLNHEQTEPIDK